VQALALGAFFACASRSDGTVWCWGSNTDGERGRGTHDERARWDKRDPGAVEPPTVVPALSNVVEIAAGSRHACAVAASRRRIWCWGLNHLGQLGVAGLPGSATPVEVALPADLGEIAAIVCAP
jgi:alpha-tubulin suppressor-like RCC1 family protein